MCIVDDECGNPPDVVPDKFWFCGTTDTLYSDPSQTAQNHPLVGSAVSAKFVIACISCFRQVHLRKKSNFSKILKNKKASSTTKEFEEVISKYKVINC